MLLADMRRRVDKIDDDIIRLLNKRAEIVLDINRTKSACGRAYKDVERKREIFRRIARRNSGPLPNFRLACIYESILIEGQ